MKKAILATAILTSAVSFGATNDTVDVRLLEKRIERIERVLELGDFPTYYEFTNAVWTVIKNRNVGNSGAKFEASKVLRRAGVDANLFKDHPRGHKISYLKKRDIVKNPPKEGRIARAGKTLDDFRDNDLIMWVTDVDDSDENRLKNCKPLLSDR